MPSQGSDGYRKGWDSGTPDEKVTWGIKGKFQKEVRPGLSHKAENVGSRAEETAWAKTRRGERRGGFVELREA